MADYPENPYEDAVNVKTVKLARNIFAADVLHRDNTITTIDLMNTEFENGDAGEAFSFLEGLTSVVNFPNNVINMYATFAGCSRITAVPHIPDSVVDLNQTYNGCFRLITPPEIPNSVVNMAGTFASCIDIKAMPIIPNSVQDLSWTFRDCLNLVDASKIPNSVTNMANTFRNCVNLITAPNIPDSVINLESTFSYCDSLSGAVFIYSNKVSNAMNCFNMCMRVKKVYIPFTYENGVNTLTYNSFVAAGYNANGSGTLNVYLKDLNKVFKKGI